jgi:putative transposase
MHAERAMHLEEIKRMPQKRPDYSPGQYYHFYNRGNNRLSIFRDQDNYLFVLRKIKKYLHELEITMLAYCLMPNHFHFLVRQDGTYPARRLTQSVFNSYSKAFNLRYQHSGTLFEGPYKVKSVTDTQHLLHLCRYIHANPVKDGLVAEPQDWPYSNFLEWIEQRQGTLIDQTFVSQHFPSPALYIEFVMDYLHTRTLPPEITRYLNNLEK